MIGVLVVLAIAVVVGLNVTFLWANNQFVGQRSAPPWLRGVLVLALSLGVGYCALLGVFELILDNSNETGLWTLIVVAAKVGWIAGACIAAVIALQSYFGDRESK
jgi:hypothetical protein